MPNIKNHDETDDIQINKRQLLIRFLLNLTFNKTEDPSVPYAGQGYVTQRRIHNNYLKLKDP